MPSVTLTLCPDCCVACSEAATITVTITGGDVTCPGCVEDPSNPGSFVNITNNGLLGGPFVLNYSTSPSIRWFLIILGGGSFSQFESAGCPRGGTPTTGALVMTLQCTDGVYRMDVTLSTGTNSILVLNALDMELGGPPVVDIVCGFNVSIAL